MSPCFVLIGEEGRREIFALFLFYVHICVLYKINLVVSKLFVSLHRTIKHKQNENQSY